MTDIYNANLSEAARRLEENISLLSPATHKTAHNLSFALLAICRELDRVSRDVGANSTKLAAILQDMADDADASRQSYRPRK